MKNRLLLALFLVVLLTTFSYQEKTNHFFNYNIKKIEIFNNFLLSEKEIKKKLVFLYATNLFFLNSEKIEKELNNIDFIESFEIKKKYPHSLKIKIFERRPIAILQNKRNKHYYTDKDNIINFIPHEDLQNLPTIFGNKENFKIFHEVLKKINFPINTVKTFYFFESNRWDLVNKKNQTIKLPIEKYEISLINFMDIRQKDNFRKYKTFDYRIYDQLILK